EGRQIRHHDLASLREHFGKLEKRRDWFLEPDRSHQWREQTHALHRVLGVEKALQWIPTYNIPSRLESVFGPSAWRDFERGLPLTPEQESLLREWKAELSFHLEQEDDFYVLLLIELGRRDASLAIRVADHLAASMIGLRSGNGSLASQPLLKGDWLCLADCKAGMVSDDAWSGEAVLVPALHAKALVMFLENRAELIPANAPGLHIEPLQTLGLRGAGLARVRLDNYKTTGPQVSADSDQLDRWRKGRECDWACIALGMANQLCDRVI